jgi:hypothetical protein
MVGRIEVMSLVNRHLSRLLTVAEASLPPAQFQAFRRVALDEFGRNGLEGEVGELERYGKTDALGMERSGPAHTGQGKEVSMRCHEPPETGPPETGR